MNILKPETIDDVLLRHYDRPEGWYHTGTHIRKVLQLLGEWQRDDPVLSDTEQEMLEYAALYHDCVMTGDDPEGASAEVAKEELFGKLDDMKLKCVCGLIKSTRPLDEHREDELYAMEDDVDWKLYTMQARLHDADWHDFNNIWMMRYNDGLLLREAMALHGLTEREFWRRKVKWLQSLDIWLECHPMYYTGAMLAWADQARLNIKTRITEVRHDFIEMFREPV